MMTRKDFQAIASILRKQIEDNRKAHEYAHEHDRSFRDMLDGRGLMLYELASELSEHFQQVNPAFNRDVFFRACGINPIKKSTALECECGVVLECSEITCPNCDEMFSTELEGVN